jgi:SCP-2 sterol transfer family
VRYLSAEWFAAAQTAIEDDQQLRELSTDLELTIEQTVTGGPDDPGAADVHANGAGTSGSSARPVRPIQWHVILDHGSARLVTGPATHADLRFRASYDVAAAIARGELAAPIAFIRGELTVGGDLNLLTTHQPIFAAVGDVLRDVRRAMT